MPRKNTEGRSSPGAYHVYNRARNRGLLFRDDDDRREFLALLADCAKRHDAVAVVAYCLMGTHFHLILWQRSEGAMGAFMASLMNSYTRYYHRRYGTQGPLFNGAYRARFLSDRRSFKRAVFYVHDNHSDGPTYRFSSHIPFIDDHRRPGWLAAEAALRVFGGEERYLAFIEANDDR